MRTSCCQRVLETYQQTLNVTGKQNITETVWMLQETTACRGVTALKKIQRRLHPPSEQHICINEEKEHENYWCHHFIRVKTPFCWFSSYILGRSISRPVLVFSQPCLSDCLRFVFKYSMSFVQFLCEFKHIFVMMSCKVLRLLHYVKFNLGWSISTNWARRGTWGRDVTFYFEKDIDWLHHSVVVKAHSCLLRQNVCINVLSVTSGSCWATSHRCIRDLVTFH